METAKPKAIMLENGEEYYFVTRPYILKNILAADIAQLTEFIFSKDPAMTKITCNLFKTHDGNWYEINDRSTLLNYQLVHQIKKAIDTTIQCCYETDHSTG